MDNLEGATLDALTKFAEELDQNRNTSIDEFLNSRPDAPHELRGLLETVVRVRNSLAHITLSPEESTRLFASVRDRVAHLAQNDSAAVLDRRPDVMILLLHFMKHLLNLDVWGDTKLVKLLFLLGKEGGCDRLVPDFYGHYAYSFGAFDAAVPKDAEMLSRKGILNMGRPEALYTFGSMELGIPNEKQVNNVYRLTPKGELFAGALLKDALAKNPDLIENLKRVVMAHGRKSTDELLSYTYNTYPDTAKNSKVREKYLKKDPRSDNDDVF